MICKKGSELGVDSKGRLVFCTTAKPVDVDGLRIAADAYTLFHPNGRIYQTHLRSTFEASAPKVSCAAELVDLIFEPSPGEGGELRGRVINVRFQNDGGFQLNLAWQGAPLVGGSLLRRRFDPTSEVKADELASRREVRGPE